MSSDGAGLAVPMTEIQTPTHERSSSGWWTRRSRKVAPAVSNANRRPSQPWTVSDGLGGPAPPEANRPSSATSRTIVHGVESVGPIQLERPVPAADQSRVMTVTWGRGEGGESSTDMCSAAGTRDSEFTPTSQKDQLPEMCPTPLAESALPLGGTPLPAIGANATPAQSPEAAEFVLLEGISVSAGLLWPKFSPERLVYMLYLRPSDALVKICPIAPAARCTVNGAICPVEGSDITVDVVTSITIHVSTGGDRPTPYVITAGIVPNELYDDLLSQSHLVCTPIRPPPILPPMPHSRAGCHLYQARMQFQDSSGQCPPLNIGDVLAVSDVARDNASGWWGARRPASPDTVDAPTARPFYWVPAMCLCPADLSTQVRMRSSSSGSPRRLWKVLSHIVRATPGDRATNQTELVQAMESLNPAELDQVQSMLKPQADSRAAHQALYYPYFTILCSIVLSLALVGTLSRFGVAKLSENPFAGAPWAGIRLSGGCWPLDVHEGHIFQPFTALIIPGGLFSFLFDLVLLRLVVMRQERVYGPVRIAGTFVLCGAAGHFTACFFTPQWISTGPEPGLVAVMTVLALELALDSTRLRRYWVDSALLFSTFACTAALGGFPGVNLWACLGGCVSGLSAALLYSRRLSKEGPSRHRTWTIGLVMALCLVVLLVVVFWSIGDGKTPWCKSCQKACYRVHGWCDPTDVSR